MTMKKITAALTVATVALSTQVLSLPAQAQDDRRFQLERTEQGIVRLDTQTGAMSLCNDTSGELVCRMAPDERAAYEQELDLLEKRVAALEQRVANSPKGLPDDDAVDRSLSIIERFMRGVMTMVREFSGDPQPDRT
jgi:hypothetical protein